MDINTTNYYKSKKKHREVKHNANIMYNNNFKYQLKCKSKGCHSNFIDYCILC